MPVNNNILMNRRQYETEMGELLARQYRALRLVAGLSEEDAYKEIQRHVATRFDTLVRMGIPPAWNREIE